MTITFIGRAFRFVYNGKAREAVILGGGVAKRGGHRYYLTYCRLSGGFRTFQCDPQLGVEIGGPLDHPEEWPAAALEALETAMA